MSSFGKKAAPAAAAPKKNVFKAGKTPAASKNVFLNAKKNPYGDTIYEGKLNGYVAIVSPTKDETKFKLNYAAADGSAQFSVGTVKEGEWGPYMSFIINNEWWFATPKENKNGPYVMLKPTGRPVEPREHSVAESPDTPEVVDVDANGHPVDEGDTAIPDEAYVPAKKAIPLDARATFGKQPQAAAGKPARFSAKKDNLDNIPF